MDTPGTPQSVADDEVLYRAIRSDANLLTYDDNGNLRISSNAFNDALRRPSVDRACLCTDGPTECQMRFAPGSGVLSLLTADVREISATHGVTGIVYCADVEQYPFHTTLHMPRSTASHRLIQTKSLCVSNTRWRELHSSNSHQHHKHSVREGGLLISPSHHPHIQESTLHPVNP